MRGLDSVPRSQDRCLPSPDIVVSTGFRPLRTPLWSPCSYFTLLCLRLRLAASRLLAFLCPVYCYISTSRWCLTSHRFRAPLGKLAPESAASIIMLARRSTVAALLGATKMLGCGATSTAPIRFNIDWVSAQCLDGSRLHSISGQLAWLLHPLRMGLRTRVRVDSYGEHGRSCQPKMHRALVHEMAKHALYPL